MSKQQYDITILCGGRTKADQDLACATGHSHTPWPTGNHDKIPSLAVDAGIFNHEINNVDYKDEESFRKLWLLVKACGDELQVPLRWGGTFSTIVDMPHFEIYPNK